MEQLLAAFLHVGNNEKRARSPARFDFRMTTNAVTVRDASTTITAYFHLFSVPERIDRLNRLIKNPPLPP